MESVWSYRSLRVKEYLNNRPTQVDGIRLCKLEFKQSRGNFHQLKKMHTKVFVTEKKRNAIQEIKGNMYSVT